VNAEEASVSAVRFDVDCWCEVESVEVSFDEVR
jgi:hypothetical protein